MANIVLCRKCNLKCPYCFANELKSSNYEDISGEALDTILDFVSVDGNVGLIGGEPLLHPDFDRIIEQIKNDERFSYVTVFTNGILADRYMSQLCSNKVKILINVNSVSDIGKCNFGKIEKNIEILLNNGMRQNITLGINLYKKEQDFSDFLSLVKKFNFDRVRFSVSIPQDRTINPIEYFNEMKATLLSFLKELRDLRVAPCPDCNVIPSCVYSKEERAFLKTLPYYSQLDTELLLGEKSVCSPIIDIYPDYLASRCFGCYDNLKIDIRKFKNINDLRNYFFMWIDSKRVHIPVRTSCTNCYKFNTFACYGSCLGFKHPRPKVQEK